MVRIYQPGENEAVDSNNFYWVIIGKEKKRGIYIEGKSIPIFWMNRLAAASSYLCDFELNG